MLSRCTASMKIMFLCQSLVVGGTQRQVSVLARALKGRNHEISVAVFRYEGPFIREIEAAGIRICDLRKGGRWDVFGFLWRLRNLIKDERPDVVYALLPVANVVSALVAPLVYPRPRIVFGVRSARMSGEPYDWLTRSQYRVEALVSGMASLAITNSHAAYQDAVARGFRAGRTVVVHNGIDTVKFAPDPIGRGRVRKKWGVADDEWLVGLMARFDPMKGHDVFFAAAAQLAVEHPSWRFVTVGVHPGDEQERAQNMAKSHGIASRVIWAGMRTDMVACFSALDIACLASRFGEGFPNVVAEAMACAIPCVVTDVGDAREIVNGFGVVVPPNDAPAIANGLRMLRARTAAEQAVVGIAGRNSITDRFGLDAAAEQTERALVALFE